MEKKIFWYFVKQKLIGLAVIILSIIAVPINDGDATFALITVPIGLYVLFSKKAILETKEYYEIVKELERSGKL